MLKKNLFLWVSSVYRIKQLFWLSQYNPEQVWWSGWEIAVMYDSACIESKFVCNLLGSLNIKIRQLGLALLLLSFRTRTCGNDCRLRLSHSFSKKKVGKSSETEASYYHAPEHHLEENIRSTRKERTLALL